VVALFWQVVDELTNTERLLLLKFISGRSRLGTSEQYAISCTGTPGGASDRLLPTAATCFLKLTLPRYSSAAILKERLLLAISNCSAIDTDFVART
jgi:hypothetical protein